MKGRIYSNQKCPVCGGIFYHDENRSGLFCKQHTQIAATGKFYVRFGRAITKRFSDYHEAERFLTGLRFENDKGTFDVRDYRKTIPSGSKTLRTNGSSKRSVQRSSRKLFNRMKTISTKLSRMGSQRNIKTIGTGEVEDFLLGDHRDREPKNVYQIRHATI
jgi:uncharacterized C2H2 Zn-finger protein